MSLRIGPYVPQGRPPTISNPTSVTGLTLWLRADLGLYQTTDTSTPVTADGQTVGLWQDQSGNSNNASQATLSFRPIYSSSVASASYNPAVAFDNVDDYMTTGLGVTNPCTIFAVWSCADASSGNYHRLISAQVNWLMGVGSTANRVTYYANGFAGYGSITNNVFLIHMVEQNSAGTVGTHWQNGTVIAGNNGGIAPGALYLSDPLFSQYANGNIAEVIVYNKQLSTSERKSIEMYLSNRYGISVPP